MYRLLSLLTLAVQCARLVGAVGSGDLLLLYRAGFEAASLHRRSSGNTSHGDSEVRMGHFDGLVRRQGCDSDETDCPGR